MQYVTAGESHGPCLTAVVSGVPAGLRLTSDDINADLARRQRGYGRGGRQQIETDTAMVLSGVRFGSTLGTPIALQVVNKDWQNWTDRMAAFGNAPADLVREVTPRPGHADLVGALRNDTNDCRNILERSSARETAARVAAGGIAKAFLAELGVQVFSYVSSIGSAAMEEDAIESCARYSPADIESSPVRCPDAQATERMIAAIDEAKSQGESLGGTFRVVATGLIPGLGDFVSGPDRLTSRLGGALFGIPAIKGVEFGIGFEAARRKGSDVHDGIAYDEKAGYVRTSNRAGGLEGGMTTGQALVAKCAMKPIPTLRCALQTVNMDTLEAEEASRERSDVCAVPAAGIVAEAEVAFVLAEAYHDAFGGKTMVDVIANRDAYMARINDRMDINR